MSLWHEGLFEIDEFCAGKTFPCGRLFDTHDVDSFPDNSIPNGQLTGGNLEAKILLVSPGPFGMNGVNWLRVKYWCVVAGTESASFDWAVLQVRLFQFIAVHLATRHRFCDSLILATDP